MRARESKTVFTSCSVNPLKLVSGFRITENEQVFRGSPRRASDYMLECPSGPFALDQPLPVSDRRVGVFT